MYYDHPDTVTIENVKEKTGHSFVNVFLDGELVENCTMFNQTVGGVSFYQKNDDGKLTVGGDHILIEHKRGSVTYEPIK